MVIIWLYYNMVVLYGNDSTISLSFTIQTKMKTSTAMRKFRRSENVLLKVMMKTRNFSLNHLCCYFTVN